MRIELRIRPADLIFKDWSAHIIANVRELSHAMPALVFRHRILYVGDDPDLAGLLMTALRRHACQVIRCPPSPSSRYDILAATPYSLLLLDDSPACSELMRLARTLERRRGTPVVSVRKRHDLRTLAETISRHLTD